MTFRSRLPLAIYQYFFELKDAIDSFISKLQVVTDSTAIVYSVRILIVILALLLGYVQSPNDNKEVSSMKKIELVDGHAKSIVDQLK